MIESVGIRYNIEIGSRFCDPKARGKWVYVLILFFFRSFPSGESLISQPLGFEVETLTLSTQPSSACSPSFPNLRTAWPCALDLVLTAPRPKGITLPPSAFRLTSLSIRVELVTHGTSIICNAVTARLTPAFPIQFEGGVCCRDPRGYERIILKETREIEYVNGNQRVVVSWFRVFHCGFRGIRDHSVRPVGWIVYGEGERINGCLIECSVGNLGRIGGPPECVIGREDLFFVDPVNIMEERSIA